MGLINSQAISVISSFKEDVDDLEFECVHMKALVKPNRDTRSDRGSLLKHLNNSITHILGVKKMTK